MLARHVHGVGAGDDPLVTYPGASTSYLDAEYLYTDRLGSVIARYRRDGSATAINGYDEYGVPGPSTGVNNNGRFRYTGQVWLPELGLYYYKARMYSPTIGRFMQTDPIGYADGMNMYAYVGNDPVNGVDPTGLFRTCWQVPSYNGQEPDDGQQDSNTVIVVSASLRCVDWDLPRLGGGGPGDGYGGRYGGGGGGTGGGGGGNNEPVPKKPQNNCKVSVNSTSDRVLIDAKIVGGAAGSMIYGTITDPATNAQVNFTSSGMSAITGFVKISFSGLISGGINALSHGLTVSGYAVGVGYQRGAGNAGASWGSITLSNYSGAEIGKFDADFAGVSLGAGAFGVGVNGVAFAADYGQVSYSKPGC